MTLKSGVDLNNKACFLNTSLQRNSIAKRPKIFSIFQTWSNGQRSDWNKSKSTQFFLTTVVSVQTVKAQREGKLQGADSKVKVSAEQMEISRLRAELARVKMERDILGKAKAYFAKGSV